MEQFRLRQEELKELKRKNLWKFIIIVVLALVMGALSIVLKVEYKSIEINMSMIPVTIPVLVVVLGWAIYRGLSRQKALFDSYVLTFSDNLITREQANTSTLSLHSFEINEIIKDKNGHFWIKANDIIIVPAQVERYEEVEALLNKIVPVTTKTSFKYKYRIVISIITLVLMLCFYGTNDKIIAGICGPILSGIFIWNLRERWKLRRSLDKSTQRSFFIYVIVLIVTIAMTVMKLMGFDY